MQTSFKCFWALCASSLETKLEITGYRLVPGNSLMIPVCVD